jgi:hypothetical protein
MILQAGREDGPAADEALADLCRAYRYPLYAFVRRRGLHGTGAVFLWLMRSRRDLRAEAVSIAGQSLFSSLSIESTTNTT